MKHTYENLFRPALFWTAFAVTITIVAVGCSGNPDSTPTPELPEPTIEVDTSIVPPVASLPSLDGSAERPIATIEDEEGIRAEFVSNELWVSTDDESELQALLERWNGEVLAEFDPAEAGLDASALSMQYLVRIDPGLASRDGLGANLQEIDETATGPHKVSSQEGLSLLAAAAAESSSGLEIGVNWFGRAHDIRSQTTEEAPSGGQLVIGQSYDSDAFQWPTHSVGSNQNTGVAEAWRVLDLAGKLDNKVKIAVLDGGFAPDTDFAPEWDAVSNIPFVEAIGTENFMPCGGEFGCPYHGTNVASAAMALPNNSYGAAGSAGPVGEGVFVFMVGDMFTANTALALAKSRGADIVNMSWGIAVPAILAWTVLPFEAVTANFENAGMLLFSSAGNDDTNVDARRSFLGVSWEKTWHTPCENAGVICVGGLAQDSTSRDPNSNRGPRQVDIFAPFHLLVGPDPDSPGNSAQAKGGTSFSSPFVAGVAALVWAADPTLSAREVRDAVFDTSRESPDDEVGRIVNALDAVLSVIDNAPPSISIDNLEDGDELPLNTEFFLSASVSDLEDGTPCCEVTWTSSADGEIATGDGTFGFSYVFGTPGPQTLTVNATDSEGLSATASVDINVINSAPEITILNPSANEEAIAGLPFTLRAEITDVNEPGQRLDCDAVVWTSSIASDPFPVTGCSVPFTFSSIGPRTIFVTATDPQGLSDSDEATLNVAPPPANFPPAVTISSPFPGPQPNFAQPLSLVGEASDPEGGEPLLYTWTVQWDTQRVIIGTTPTLDWVPLDTIPFFDFQDGTLVQAALELAVRDPEGNIGTDVIPMSWRVIR